MLGKGRKLVSEYYHARTNIIGKIGKFRNLTFLKIEEHAGCKHKLFIFANRLIEKYESAD